MSLRRGSWLGPALLVSALAPARASRAEPPAAYDLDYVADIGCPERSAFALLVQAQLDEARERTPAAHARASVNLRRDDLGATGSLELLRDDGTRYVRELAGGSCDEAAEGLAFVLAYALGGGDPENAPLPEIVAPTAPNALAPEVPRAAPEAVATPEPVSPSPSPRSQLRRTKWRFGFGVQLGLRTGVGPIWTPVEAGLLDVRLSGGRVLAPTFRAALVHADPIMRLDRFGSTRFSWLAGSVEACPLQLPLLTRLQLLPCVGTHVGRMTAAGQPNGQVGGSGASVDKLWLDAIGALRLELLLLGVLRLEAQGDLIVPLTQYRFAFDNPDTPVYQVPGVAFAGFLGLGSHFP